MSVRENERKESRMEVQNKAVDLLSLTFRNVANERVVPKRHRWSLGNALTKAAVELCTEIDMANGYRLDDPIEFKARRMHQRTAMARSYSLLSLIMSASGIACFDASRIEIWSRSVLEVQSLLKRWMESDTERSKKGQGCF